MFDIVICSSTYIFHLPLYISTGTKIDGDKYKLSDLLERLCAFNTANIYDD